MLKQRGGQHTPDRIEGLLVAETSRFRGVASSIFEKPAILLGDGEGTIRADQEYEDCRKEK